MRLIPLPSVAKTFTAFILTHATRACQQWRVIFENKNLERKTDCFLLHFYKHSLKRNKIHLVAADTHTYPIINELNSACICGIALSAITSADNTHYRIFGK